MRGRGIHRCTYRKGRSTISHLLTPLLSLVTTCARFSPTHVAATGWPYLSVCPTLPETINLRQVVLECRCCPCSWLRLICWWITCAVAFASSCMHRIRAHRGTELLQAHIIAVFDVVPHGVRMSKSSSRHHQSPRSSVPCSAQAAESGRPNAAVVRSVRPAIL